MSAKTDTPPFGARERLAVRSGALLATVISTMAALGASWYGFLEQDKGHPTIRLAGALALSAGGLAAVVLVTPRVHRPLDPLADGREAPPRRLNPQSAGAGAAILGLLSMAAALIHFAVIEQHLAEYWLYGLFFIVVGLAQMVWALAISAAPTRWLMTFGVIGNALVVITWVVTRTAGSLVGPAASAPAKVGFGDLVATVLQLLIVAGGIGWLSGRPPVRGRGWVEHARVIAALAVLPFLVLALYSAVGGPPFVSMVG